MDEQRKLALITGGAGALGVVTGEVLARRGHMTYLLDADGDRAAAAAGKLAGQGLRVQGRALDVTDAAAATTLMDSLAEQYGGIDVLVNMAGVARNASFAKISEADFNLTMRTHVNGTLNCMQAVAASMRRRKYGRVINISSVAALGTVGGGAYGAAKGAIESLSRVAAIEWAQHGITVNCVAPGLIAAGMFLRVPEEYQKDGIERTPMKRAGTAEEVADAIAFFASLGASFVTGQTLFVCGGLSVGF